MENLNETGSNSSAVDTPVVQENSQNQTEGVDQNRRSEGQLGAESIMESFRSGSSSAVYEPNQQNVVEDLTRDVPTGEQKFNIEPLVTLVKEQSAEIENLKRINSDLTAANADLRTQVNEKSETLENLTEQLSEAKRKIEKLDDLEATIESLQNQLREKNVICQDKTNQLSELHRKVTDSESEIEKLRLRHLQTKIR